MSASTIQTLKSRGYLVICYISGGTLEPWRSDASLFPKGALGLKMADWDEWWFDIRATNPNYSTLKSLMAARVKAVAAKGKWAFEVSMNCDFLSLLVCHLSPRLAVCPSVRLCCRDSYMPPSVRSRMLACPPPLPCAELALLATILLTMCTC